MKEPVIFIVKAEQRDIEAWDSKEAIFDFLDFFENEMDHNETWNCGSKALY